MSARYRTIVADPPWEYDKYIPTLTRAKKTWRRPHPYPMMPLADIIDLPVQMFAEFSCRLFLWTTSRHLPAAFKVMDAWGFTYKQTIVWRKTGQVTVLPASIAPNHAEYLLVGVIGKPPRKTHWESSVVEAPIERHSKKPELFMDIIETVSPGPYLELFARRNRLGWDTWGNEAIEHVEVAT